VLNRLTWINREAAGVPGAISSPGEHRWARNQRIVIGKKFEASSSTERQNKLAGQRLLSPSLNAQILPGGNGQMNRTQTKQTPIPRNSESIQPN